MIKFRRIKLVVLEYILKREEEEEREVYLSTVSENNIVQPKMQNHYWCTLIFDFFQYYESDKLFCFYCSLYSYRDPTLQYK